MTQINSSTYCVKTHAGTKRNINGINDFSKFKSFETIKKTGNSFIDLTGTSSCKSITETRKVKLFEVIRKSFNIIIKSHGRSSEPSLQRSVRLPAFDANKRNRTLVNDALKNLDIKGHAKQDDVYASQACETVLASVYSNKKDSFCKEMKSKGTDITGFLKEIGVAAQKAGLPGKVDENDIFTPTGAGANAFLSNLLSSVQLTYPHVLLREPEKNYIKAFAEKKISKEVAEICKSKGMITPDEFALELDNIALKYL